ncbi:MAG: hypothetical protein COA84_14780 [Robiginitomaculum sp.]|nr:MAG: hypothetical protein COA84_14780 [Robiginitomaculum sp.]
MKSESYLKTKISPLAYVLYGAALLFSLSYLLRPDLTGVLSPFVKAAPIWLLALMAIIAKETPLHKRLAMAFVFSGFGDFFLALDFPQSFAAGMGSFLLAQLSFIACFWPRRRAIATLAPSEKVILVMVMVWTIGLGVWLLPLAGVMAPALMVYFGALSLMVLLALGGNAPKVAKTGALLFFLSDSLIGIDRFVSPLPGRHFAVMGSYYLAQALLFWGLMRKSD